MARLRFVAPILVMAPTILGVSSCILIESIEDLPHRPLDSGAASEDSVLETDSTELDSADGTLPVDSGDADTSADGPADDSSAEVGDAAEDSADTKSDSAPPCPSGMVHVAGGSYTLAQKADAGSSTISGFCMDLMEVSASDYAVCSTTGSCLGAGVGTGCNGGVAGRESHPINCVDWSQAANYCAKQSKRLPTEEEWEWAARGGAIASTYPWGFSVPTAGDVPAKLCWISSTTCSTGGFPAGKSPLGIVDLIGDVEEWTSTDYDTTAKIIRGGHYGDNIASAPHSSMRRAAPPTSRFSTIGFRCVK